MSWWGDFKDMFRGESYSEQIDREMSDGDINEPGALDEWMNDLGDENGSYEEEDEEETEGVEFGLDGADYLDEGDDEEEW